jgi:hypothetical protein
VIGIGAIVLFALVVVGLVAYIGLSSASTSASALFAQKRDPLSTTHAITPESEALLGTVYRVTKIKKDFYPQDRSAVVPRVTLVAVRGKTTATRFITYAPTHADVDKIWDLQDKLVMFEDSQEDLDPPAKGDNMMKFLRIVVADE